MKREDTGRVPAGPGHTGSAPNPSVSASGECPSRGVAPEGRLTESHLRIYRRIADGTAGAFMAPGDVGMLLDEIVRLEGRESAARSIIGGALRGISDDYMTSERHHPGYVLIPTAKFEQLRAAETTLAAPLPASAAEAQRAETGTGSVHEDAIGAAETPTPSPRPQSPNAEEA